MKYLFLVHSNLIYGMAREVIGVEKWAEEDVVWVTDRNFSSAFRKGRVIDISTLNVVPFRWSEAPQLVRNARQNRQHLRRIDGLLSALREDFIVILPHLRNFKYYALVTHPACTGFYFLEEGKLSYTGGFAWPDNLVQKWKTALLTGFYHYYVQGRVPPFPPDFSTDHPKYLGTFATNELAFPNIPVKKLIPSPFQPDPALKHYQRVLVLGPYPEFGELPLASQLQCLKLLFQHLEKRGIRQLHYKFHPSQLEQGFSPPAIRALMQSFAENIQFDEIPPAVSLENIAASAPADFYLSTSSTAIYAIALKRKVYSYAKTMVRLHPDFTIVLEAIPGGIREKMIFLDLE